MEDIPLGALCNHLRTCQAEEVHANGRRNVVDLDDSNCGTVETPIYISDNIVPPRSSLVDDQQRQNHPSLTLSPSARAVSRSSFSEAGPSHAALYPLTAISDTTTSTDEETPHKKTSANNGDVS